MPFLERWRSDREVRAKAAAYAAALSNDPNPELTEWLAATATGGDLDHARWELRYARRALGLLAAERDALDDRTASLVAGALAEAFRRDPAIASDRVGLAERQFNQRLSAYGEAVRERRPGTATSERIAQELLRFAGGEREWGQEVVAHLANAVADFLTNTNAELRKAFGQAALPENVRPSSLGRGTGGGGGR
ncbi:MAG TPA: hypothetical protein VKZ41_13900 [Gemmatimonadales bacterium]|nr:hypothetical protein [Gemmatimonadales bacterium]